MPDPIFDTIADIINVVSSFFRTRDSDFLTWTPGERETRSVVLDFLKSEPEWMDNAIKNDPALSSKPREEAIQELLTYQGLQAIAWHRKAHEQYEAGHFAEARKISQGVRRLTAGIEIHPGAKIGKNFFIDHGTGVVIGETAEIGDNVMLYHRVTLGNDGSPVPAGERRHPKIGNNVTIYTGAEILGAATIGDNVNIGAGTKIIGPVTVGNKAKINSQLYINNDVRAESHVVDTMKFGEPIYDGGKDYKEGQRIKKRLWADRTHRTPADGEREISS